MVMQVLMEEQAIEHMLRIFKIVILNKKHCQSRKSCAQEVLRTQKNLRSRNCRQKFIKNLLLEKRKGNM